MAYLAFDKSLRRFDADGHMIVEMSRISKANICPYRGNEIPNWEALQLDPNKVYKLFRDPRELEKAASSFDGKPLLIKHVAISADVPNQDTWVGTLGKCTFEDPYLVVRPLTVIHAEAQALIEAEVQDELSAGYRYVAEMIPGTFGGEMYDGRMTDIQGNHVALVSTGRAGPDVHVADEHLPELRSMKNPKLIARLQKKIPALAALTSAELLAMDAELGEVPSVSVVKLSADEEKACMDEALAEKKKTAGEDAELTDEEKESALAKAKDKKAKDAMPEGKDKAEDEEDDEAKDEEEEETPPKKAKDKRARDAAPDHRDDFAPGKGKDKRGKDKAMDTGMSMDEANRVIAKGIAREGARIRAEVTKQQRDIAIACDEMLPLVGRLQVHAFDSAAEVYAFALDKNGVEVEEDFPKAGLRALALNEVKHVTAARKPTKLHGMDSRRSEFDLDSLLQKAG